MAVTGLRSPRDVRCAADLDHCEHVQVDPKSHTLVMMGLARWSFILVMLGSACDFSHGVPNQDNGSGSGSADASVVVDGSTLIDAGVIVKPDAQQCFGSFINICLQSVPTNDYTVEVNTDIDTNTGCPYVFNQPTGQTLCGIVAKTIHINASLRANGPRPLLLIATDTITISAAGSIDVGSYKILTIPVTEVIGAGAATGNTLCGNASNGGSDNGASPYGGGGGAGGSFVGRGGAGARGVNGAGGTAGSSANVFGTPTFMRGGCRGTSGGTGNGNIPGIGGAGGGAVLAIAGVSITNAGHIRAGGMGGYGGNTESGGGGGGSGGMIVLDAMTIMNTGILNANGGGGGEGGGNTSGDNGNSALTGTSAALGGAINTNGGNGGEGSWPPFVTGEQGATGNNGGGAGGGGAGAIRIFPAQSVGGTVSPNPI
jgi:hypothetical protein